MWKFCSKLFVINSLNKVFSSLLSSLGKFDNSIMASEAPKDKACEYSSPVCKFFWIILFNKKLTTFSMKFFLFSF